MIALSRRGLITGLAGLFVAPAIARAESLMRVNPRLLASTSLLTLDAPRSVRLCVSNPDSDAMTIRGRDRFGNLVEEVVGLSHGVGAARAAFRSIESVSFTPGQVWADPGQARLKPGDMFGMSFLVGNLTGRPM